MRRFSFHSNGPRRWSHQCKTQRTRGCKGGTVGHYELMSEMALGRRQRERNGRGINRYGEKEERKAELAQLLARCGWESRRNMPELKIWRDDERGCPTRGVLWQEERTKRAKDEDKGKQLQCFNDRQGRWGRKAPWCASFHQHNASCLLLQHLGWTCFLASLCNLQSIGAVLIVLDRIWQWRKHGPFC